MMAALAAGTEIPSTPVGAAADSLISYVLGYGVLGVAVVAFTFRLIVPRSAIDDGRRDLLKQVGYLEAKLAATEKQRDEAMDLARTQLVPMLMSFNATSDALIPLLRELVTFREVDISADRSQPVRHRRPDLR